MAQIEFQMTYMFQTYEIFSNTRYTQRQSNYQELEFNELCHNKYKIQLIIMIENIQAVSSNT